MSKSRISRTLARGLFPVLLLGITACAAENAGPDGRVQREGRTMDKAMAPAQDDMSMPPGMPPPENFKPDIGLDADMEGGTETYARIVANPFKLAAREPLSTFSADVNTASYSNVRRILEQRRLPPPDAVRVAEMINYFSYDYPEPQGNDPVAIGLEYGPCPWNPNHKLLKIALKARTIHPAELPPRNFVFLIDVSGSMGQPNKLPLVQQSLRYLVEQLDRQDRVSIVTYAGSAGVALSPTPGDQKDRILQVVNSLRAGGGTNGEGGLELAYQQADANFNTNAVNRVIIATDGDFNIGRSSAEQMVELIKQKRQTGVYLSVLGYGIGNLKDQTLELLARHGNGHYAYIDSELEARKVFVEQGGALVTVAKDVKLQVDFNPTKVQAYRQLGYENRVLNNEDFDDPTVDAGEMGSGHAVTALYEVVPVGVVLDVPSIDQSKYAEPLVPKEAANSPEMLSVRMVYKNPADDTSAPTFEVTLPEGVESDQPSPDFHFAAAVAEFAMLLRNSPYKGNASFDDVERLLAQGITEDPNGHKAEFAKLVQFARAAKP